MNRRQYVYSGNNSIFLVIVLLFIILFPSFSWMGSQSNQNPAFQYYSQDSALIKVFEVRDADNILEMYKAKVSSPVCEDGTCYDVELFFYWDLFGSYLKYELIPGKSLTKMKHTPFSKADYQKLSQILLNKHPAFVKLRKEQLITKANNNSVDGISGATVAAVKKEVVAGAAYTCYTLWHIANGTVADRIQEHTMKNLNAPLLQKIVFSNSLKNQFSLINSFDEREFRAYLPEVLQLISHNKGYFAWNAINKLPDNLLLSAEVQVFFAQNYKNLEYDAQVLFLQKLQNKQISNDLARTLIHSMDGINYTQNGLIIQQIYYNINILKRETIQVLLDVIHNKKMDFSEETQQMIIALKKKVQA